jgi:hypothetical protein
MGIIKEMAHIIIMYFDPNTKSPISLLELGLNAREQKLVVMSRGVEKRC